MSVVCRFVPDFPRPWRASLFAPKKMPTLERRHAATELLVGPASNAAAAADHRLGNRACPHAALSCVLSFFERRCMLT